MERDRSIYLIGLFAVMGSSVLLFVYLLSPSPIWRSLGLFVSPLLTIASLFGVFRAWQFYHDKRVSENVRKSRRRHFMGHTLVLSMGLVFSIQNLFVMNPKSGAMAMSQLEVTISNTSDTAIQNLELSLGMKTQKVEQILPRAQQRLHFNVLGETRLKVKTGSEETLREAEVLITSEDSSVLVRIDYQGNLLPEVR